MKPHPGRASRQRLPVRLITGKAHRSGPLYDTLEPRLPLAQVQIIAAGVTGQETIELQVAGQTVRTWTSLGGNAYAGQFVSLSHTTTGALTASQVRIAFTNDLYDPGNGIDRNVRIDALVIDGVRFETESPAVYSTGTWKPADGVTPGFRESEYLHSNGWFQYAAGGGGGSLIRIDASGDEGGEAMELRIDGVTVASYTVTTASASYTWQATETVAASRIRVAFTNDAYDPGNGIDRNLNVDRIVVDGTIHDTTGPNVYSTGTWKPADGIVPGFRESRTLHANGWFQYDFPRSFGTIGLQSSVINVAENAGSASLTIDRTGGSDGTITIDYRTVALTATPGADYSTSQGTVTLFPGETSRTINVPLLDDAAVEVDEQFSFTIDNVQGGATLGAPRTATVTIEDNDANRAAGTGLLGEYFDAASFTSRFINRVDPQVNFNWGTGAPASGMGADTFSVRWTGRIEPRFTETYEFRTRTDDGVRLWVNGQLLIDRWVAQATTTWSGTIILQANVFYDLKLEYFENTGSASAELFWTSPRQALELIPASQLYPATPPPVTPGDNLQTQVLFTGLSQPTSIDFSPDGSNLFIAEQRGIIRVARNGVLQASPFLDFRDWVNGTRDRGLLDIAVHPDFFNQPYVYLSYTYDPPQVNSQASGTLAGPDGNGNRAGRVTRVTANAATNYTTIVPNSEVVLVGNNSTWTNFNGFVNSTVNFSEPPAGILPGGGNLQDFIATDSESHTVGSVEFGPGGMLYISIGDGTSYNQVDPRTARVQDVDNLSGKILRVDPLTGRGLSGNPFWSGNPDQNRSKVWQYGLRNPFRIAHHPVTGALYVGDVGWTQWEELNASPAGANFGWPWYEGGNGTSLRTGGYQNLAAAQAFYASGQPVTPAVYALNHAASGINAIIMGDVYSGNVFPAQYRDNVFFNDLGQGIVRNIRFNTNGTIASVNTFATGHQYVVHMAQGPDGNLYYVDIDDGRVGRWTFVENGSGAAAGGVATGSPATGGAAVPGGGSGVVIAVIDSGIDPNHPALAGQLWSNAGEVPGDGIDNEGNGLIDDVNGFDFVSRSGQLSDPLGHGTLVASLIAGRATSAWSGLAPEARLMPLRVLDETGHGSAIDIAAAIRYAVEQGANIIAVPASVGSESPTLRAAVDWAGERGVLIVAAAGNEAASEPGYLAQLSREFSHILSVGAFDASGNRLPESNRVGLSGTVQLDAPGIAFGPGAGGTTTWRGTSVSTAFTGAAAALALWKNPELDARQLRELLLATGISPGSGSDSAGRIDIGRSLELAARLNEVAFLDFGSQFVVRATGGDDTIRIIAQGNAVTINGVTFEIAGLAQKTQVVVEGGAGADRLTLVGSTSGNDYGLLRPGWASLTTPGQFIRGAGFESVSLLAGGGNTVVDLFDSAGDDTLELNGNHVQLAAGGEHLSASGFRLNRVFASLGDDRASMLASGGADKLLARRDFTRLVQGVATVQANQFDEVAVDMGGGFDSVIFEGSYRDDRLVIGVAAGELAGDGFVVGAGNLERTTSYGHGGNDEARIVGGLARETVNAKVLNALLVGPGYDHRAWSFEQTVIVGGGGADHITLHGSAGAELLESAAGLTRFFGTGWETEALDFPTVLVLGNGGSDAATLAGSDQPDWFWASPVSATLIGDSRSLTAKQFADVRFTGNGEDTVALVDRLGSDHLHLDRTRAVLSGTGYRIETMGMSRLRATSAFDAPPDSLESADSTLDYTFERFGDWVDSD